MRNKIIPGICAFLLGAFAAQAPAFSKKPLPGTAAVSKAGDVTLAELDQASERYMRQVRRLSPDKVFTPVEKAELDASTLTDLILRKIFLRMAENDTFKVLDSDVQERWSIVCSGLFDNDEKKFLQALAEDGWTDSAYRANLREIVLTEKVRGAFMEGADADSAAVRRWYDTHRDSFRIEEMEMSHILIAAPERDAPERGLKSVRTVFVERGVPADSLGLLVEQETRAREARARLLLDSARAGTPFADLARRHSEDASSAQGGSLGLVQKGRMVKPFEDAAFALKKGGLSGVVRTEFGFHVIRADSDPVSRVQAFDEVEYAVASRLRAQNESRRLAALEKKWKVRRYTPQPQGTHNP